jgi:predicted DNA-binding transcriptional regulator YafY
VWYLVALWQQKTSVYRVSRIREAHLLDEPCARPEGFDLAAFWRRSSEDYLAHLPRYLATVRVSPAIREQVIHRCSWQGVEQTGPPGPDGWTTLEIVFESEGDACRYAVGWGAQLEVVAPPALRRQVIDLAQEVVGLYARAGS